MSKYQYDVTVIGGGSGGLVAARVTAALGARTLLIDKERLGGDCLHYGCVPSKALIHAAKLVHSVREATSLGADGSTANIKVDMAKVTARIQGAIKGVEENEGVYTQNVEVKFGTAHFLSNHEMQINDEVITSRDFVVATGSRPARPDLEGLAEVGYMTNEDVFDLMHLPSPLVIVGGGPIGIEMAQSFARLGSDVTVIQGPDRILPKEEKEVSELMTTILTREGVKIVTGARLQKVTRDGDHKVVHAKKGDETLTFRAQEIILALGRSPNVENLRLEAAGIKYDSKGIRVNEYLQTDSDNIYAIGDVIGGYLFTHVAAYQGGVVARNVISPIGKKKADYRVVPWVTFTDPECSRVGLTEAEAMKKHGKIRVLTFPWGYIDRAQAEGETEGFIKIIAAEKSDDIYGAHIVGARSGEMLAELSLAMQYNLGLDALMSTITAYPTMAVGLQNAAFEGYLASGSLASAKKILKPILSWRG
jgi:dihydrolipoamide dehydrogenase